MNLLEQIFNKQYDEANKLFENKMNAISERKIIEMKKMIAAEMSEEEIKTSPAMQKAFDAIDKEFSGKNTEKAKKQLQAARNKNPDYQAWKKSRSIGEVEEKVPFNPDPPRKKRPDEPKTAKGLARAAMRAMIAKKKQEKTQNEEVDHDDEMEDKKLIRQMVKSDALKEDQIDEKLTPEAKKNVRKAIGGINLGKTKSEKIRSIMKLALSNDENIQKEEVDQIDEAVDAKQKIINKAQEDADRSGDHLSVLNLNTVGAPMYVIRKHDSTHETGKWKHQFVTKVSPKKKIEEEQIDEAQRIKIVRARIRGGKIQRRKKVANVPGMTIRGGRLIRMSPAERRRRKMGQRRGKLKRRAKKNQMLRKRKLSLIKRSRLGV